MSQRQTKRERRFLRKQFEERYQDTADMLAKSDHQFLKPRPKWIPTFVWIWGLRLFVRIK